MVPEGQLHLFEDASLADTLVSPIVEEESVWLLSVSVVLLQMLPQAVCFLMCNLHYYMGR